MTTTTAAATTKTTTTTQFDNDRGLCACVRAGRSCRLHFTVRSSAEQNS
jgi:hypothetical protein